MSKIGEWTEKVKIVKDNLKYYNFVTEDGEVVRLHDKSIEELAMGTVNMSEELKGNRTDKQLEIAKAIAERTEFENILIEECGSFYFNFYGRLASTIDNPAMLFRFLYLCTYMNYDGYLSDGRRLIKADGLKELLRLKDREFYETKKYLLSNNLISIDDKIVVSINANYCKKGKVNKIGKIEVIRMFNNAIRGLYEKSLPREHKKLALLVKLLPYLNFKHNIICKNTDCEYKEYIEPYSLPELAELLGYGRTNTTKLKKDLFKLRFDNELVIGIFECDNGKFIYVNPKVMYKATNSILEFREAVDMFKNESDLFTVGSLR